MTPVLQPLQVAIASSGAATSTAASWQLLLLMHLNTCWLNATLPAVPSVMQGSFNGADTRDSCRPCSFGLTTSDAGAGRSAADCKLDLGFGFHDGGVKECPIGDLP